LRERKRLLEYTNCDLLVRMGTILLNELMKTTRRGAEGRIFGE
jgi:hypothetical protein